MPFRKKSIFFILLALFIVSCSSNENANSFKKIAVYSPNFNLPVTFGKNIKQNQHGKNLENSFSYTQDFLTDEEKLFLDELLNSTISAISENYGVEVIKINEKDVSNSLVKDKIVNDNSYFEQLPLEIKKDSVKILKYKDFYEQLTHEDEVFAATFGSPKISFKLPSLSTYHGRIYEMQKSDLEFMELKDEIHQSLENNSEKYQEFKAKKEGQLSIYVPKEYAEIEAIDEWDTADLCKELNVDGILFLNYFFSVPNRPTLLLTKKKYSASIHCDIKLINKKRKYIFSELVKGKTDSYEYEKDNNPSLRNIAFITKKNGTTFISRPENSGRGNFTLDNFFRPGIIQAKENFIKNLNNVHTEK